jgi:hypothetical protein
MNRVNEVCEMCYITVVRLRYTGDHVVRLQCAYCKRIFKLERRAKDAEQKVENPHGSVLRGSETVDAGPEDNSRRVPRSSERSHIRLFRND